VCSKQVKSSYKVGIGRSMGASSHSSTAADSSLFDWNHIWQSKATSKVKIVPSGLWRLPPNTCKSHGGAWSHMRPCSVGRVLSVLGEKSFITQSTFYQSPPQIILFGTEADFTGGLSCGSAARAVNSGKREGLRVSVSHQAAVFLADYWS
jgi:hypothetical protein